MFNSRSLAFHGEGSSLAYTRTPARGLARSNGSLQENALYTGPTTMNTKGKASLLQTPFRPSALAGKNTGLEKQASTTTMTSRPLGDKTPFPNRQCQLQTPAPQKAKSGKFAMVDPALAKTPGALLLPSARRKSLRLPRSASKKFTTPAQQGQFWDVSDIDIDPDVGEEGAEEAKEAEPDYDEIEYMPPKMPEQPWEPWFDMPDYKKAGKMLLDFAHSYPIDDTLDLYYAADITTQINVDELLRESGGFTVDLLPLADLVDEDDTFYSFEDEPKPSTLPKPSTSTLHTRKPSQSSQLVQPAPAAAPRYMTRAASRLQAMAEQASRPTATRSNSNSSGSGSPSTGQSSRSNTPVGTNSRVTTRGLSSTEAGTSRLPRRSLSLLNRNIGAKDVDDIPILLKDSGLDEDFEFEV